MPPTADTSPGVRPEFGRAVATLFIGASIVTRGEIHQTQRDRDDVGRTGHEADR
ncbi:hypothetical protein SAMN05660874_01456 [Saccharopolyspora flava]|uniref:Uncharacterized protein n=1 Tax=Saccharopolyspora flava TaxID=95161 RepID=A0A1I6QHP7_9PSEU|nr:hypothetical protein SAMN05660874_01456 [Saccharopolyspora flava]